jgi:uncharacterized damage-inducible protein DinB
MTLQEIKLLHAFNSWANNRIFEAVERLTPEQLMQEMKSSHGSIYGTLLHMVGAEKIWLSRWVGRPDVARITAADAPTLAELKTLWEKAGYETAKFLSTMTDRNLQDTFTMITAKGETLTHVYWQAFQHMVDHSTYHRGQVITLLRQLGVRPPSTGLIMFYRETSKRKQS